MGWDTGMKGGTLTRKRKSRLQLRNRNKGGEVTFVTWRKAEKKAKLRADWAFGWKSPWAQSLRSLEVQTEGYKGLEVQSCPTLRDPVDCSPPGSSCS